MAEEPTMKSKSSIRLPESANAGRRKSTKSASRGEVEAKISFKIETKSSEGSLEENESQESIGAHSAHSGGYNHRNDSEAFDDDNFDDLGRNGAMGPDDDDIWTQDHTFSKLQDIYNRTINGLELSESRGVSMDPIKKLFENVWEGIERSHDNVLKLRKKDHLLSVELSTVMAKTQTLIKLAEDDPVVCQKLKSKLESAWGLADVGEAEERKNLIKINQFKDEITILNRSIDAAARTEGQDTITELNKLKHGLEIEKMNALTEASRVHSNIESIKVKREGFEINYENLKEKMQLVQQEIAMQAESIEKETARKAQLDRDIAKTKKSMMKKIHELSKMDENVSEAQERLAEAEKNLYAQRLVNEEALREKELATDRFGKMKEDFDKQVSINEKLVKDIAKKEDDLKVRENDLKDAKHDFTHATRQFIFNTRKIEHIVTTLEKLDIERDSLKEKLILLEKALEQTQKKLDENRRKVEELDKERSTINHNLQKVTAATNQQISQAKIQQVAVRNLEVELTAFEKEIIQQQETIARLERERDNYSHEATKLAHQVALRLDDIKKLDLTIFEYQRKLGEVEAQLKKQQQILDATTYEKAILHRTLRDTITEIKDNVIKIHHLGLEITRLKFQLYEKDAVIRSEAENYERIVKDTTFFSSESKRIKRLEYDLQRQIDGLGVERSILGRTIAEIEGEMSKQNYYAKSAESRKEVYFRKLMNKEKEVKDIWEKWRVLHSTIRIGAYHFRNIMEEIRQLRFFIYQSKKEKLIFKSANRNVQKLRHEIAVMENLISKEICMCNSLKEQMKHPINVHRWRVLECAYPKSFELVQKSNLLTKRLVGRNNLLANQAEDLILKQQIYCQIRLALNKSPGLEAPENVRYYSHLLAAKRKQFATLKNELKESEAQKEYYKIEIGNIQTRVLDLKAKYFKKMRKIIKTRGGPKYYQMMGQHHRHQTKQSPSQSQSTTSQLYTTETETTTAPETASSGHHQHHHHLQIELAEPNRHATESEQAKEELISVVNEIANDEESRGGKKEGFGSNINENFDKYLY